MSKLPRDVIRRLVEGEQDSFEVNGYELRGIHPSESEFYIAIYKDGRVHGTLDGSDYSELRDFHNAARRQVGIEVTTSNLGDLFG